MQCDYNGEDLSSPGSQNMNRTIVEEEKIKRGKENVVYAFLSFRNISLSSRIICNTVKSGHRRAAIIGCVQSIEIVRHTDKRHPKGGNKCIHRVSESLQEL